MKSWMRLQDREILATRVTDLVKIAQHDRQAAFKRTKPSIFHPLRLMRGPCREFGCTYLHCWPSNSSTDIPWGQLIPGGVWTVCVLSLCALIPIHISILSVMCLFFSILWVDHARHSWRTHHIQLAQQRAELEKMCSEDDIRSALAQAIHESREKMLGVKSRYAAFVGGEATSMQLRGTTGVRVTPFRTPAVSAMTILEHIRILAERDYAKLKDRASSMGTSAVIDRLIDLETGMGFALNHLRLQLERGEALMMPNDIPDGRDEDLHLRREALSARV